MMTKTLSTVGTNHHGALVITYSLTLAENAFELVEPYVLGLAINGLLMGSWTGLFLLFVTYVLRTSLGTLRRLYDTRVFTRIYSEMATDLVTSQRGRGVEVSRVTTRSALIWEIIEFFETGGPLILRAGVSTLGALVMLTAYDLVLLPCCLALLGPLLLINRAYARRTFRLSRILHNQQEREVDVVTRTQPSEIAHHYGRLRRWQIRISDAEAQNFATMEVFVLALYLLVLTRACLTGQSLGAIVAMTRYLWMFIGSLDAVPELVGQFSRIRDITHRIEAGTKPLTNIEFSAPTPPADQAGSERW